MKIWRKTINKFLSYAVHKQTNRWTNANDYITSAEGRGNYLTKQSNLFRLTFNHQGRCLCKVTDITFLGNIMSLTKDSVSPPTLTVMPRRTGYVYVASDNKSVNLGKVSFGTPKLMSPIWSLQYTNCKIKIYGTWKHLLELTETFQNNLPLVLYW